MKERERPGTWPMNPTLGDYFSVLKTAWWKIASLSLASGLIAFLLLLKMQDVYGSFATITPTVDEKKQNPVLGSLTSLGVNVGGPSKIEDLEALFRSNDLTVRVFRKYDVWPYLLKEKYDPKTKTVRADWWDRMLEGKSGPIGLGDWDAIRAVKSRLKVTVNRKLGTLTLTFECPSPEGSAAVIGYYLEEAKSRLQEEAIDKANKNKHFIEAQIGKTYDVLTRDRLYSLYGQEIEREMLARNRQQFVFTLIDSPMIPDKKTRPRRLLIAAQTTIVSVLVFCFFFLYRAQSPKTVSSVE